MTKVGLWGEEGLVALTRSELTTPHPQLGWAEQDPLRWWTSVVIACAEARAQAPRGLRAGRRGGLLGGAPDLRPGDPGRGRPSARGILWSDRRGPAEAAALAGALGGEDINRARTGIPLDAGAVAAKLAWIAGHEPDRLTACDAWCRRATWWCCA